MIKRKNVEPGQPAPIKATIYPNNNHVKAANLCIKNLCLQKAFEKAYDVAGTEYKEAEAPV